MRPPRPDDGRAPRPVATSPAIPIVDADLVAEAPPVSRMTRAARSAALAFALATLASAPALSRESDFTQPIDVDADRSEYDQRSGTQTLIGNVEIRQGTIRISADRVAIVLENTKLARIEGSGSPIRFEQQDEAGNTVRGEAREIRYDARDNTLVLSGGATLAQPGQSLSSERIAFDARSQTVSAEGGPAAEGDGGTRGRVSIRLDAPPSERNR